MNKILVTGACGQLGTELVSKLRELKGKETVIASDIRPVIPSIEDGPFVHLDVTNTKEIHNLIESEGIVQIYHLAAILSANAEKDPLRSWDINMSSLLNILEICRESKIRLFWPSSIAVFGPNSPKKNTPQDTIMDPNTVYGISKLAGERWCEYYHQRYDVDVRSVRYPGIISYRTPPGGGTTDYAIEIFHKAAAGETYTSFLTANSELPMMYIDDAIRATIELMEASQDKINVWSSYNIAGISFDPQTLADAIRNQVDGFAIEYSPDFRQSIADSWPSSIDDSAARKDWNWEHEFDMDRLVGTMLEGLSVDQ